MASQIPLPSLPNTLRSPAITAFLTKYYTVSNHPPGHDEYAALFTPDGEFSMNAKVAKGTDEILALRKAIWAHVPARDHLPKRIYTHGDDELDLMVYGTVEYGHHAGHKSSTEWAARMELVQEGGGEVRVKRYHIIVDSAAHV